MIQRYVALADPKALGLGVNVFISISLKEQRGIAAPSSNGALPNTKR